MGIYAEWEKRVLAGQQWREEDAIEALSAYQASGQSMADFAQEHHITVQRLLWWKKRVRKQPSEQFLPVVIQQSGLASSNEAVAVITCGSIRLEIADPTRVSALWIRDVVIALKASDRS
jgi:hypothetical protein